MQGLTSAGVAVLAIIIARSVIGFREDYLYFGKYKKEKFNPITYYKYLKSKVTKDENQVKRD